MKSRFQYGAVAVVLLFTAGACSHEPVRPANLLDALPRLLSTGAKIVPAAPVSTASGEAFHSETQSNLPSREFPVKSVLSL